MKRLTAPLAVALAAVTVAACGTAKDQNGNPVNDRRAARTTSSSRRAATSRSRWSPTATRARSGRWSRRAPSRRPRTEGVKLIWSPSNNDPQKEAQLIDAAVSQKVDGLAVCVPNADAIKASLAKATDAGIPIVTLNSGLDDSKALGAITHVGQTEKIAGTAAGAKLKDEGVKKILCVIHEQANFGLEDRCAGVKEGFGGDVVNQQVKGTDDIATTQTEIKSKLQADKSFDAVMTLNPDIAAAAMTAIKDAGSSAKLATFDLSPAIIKAIGAGTVLFAVDQQQYLQGYLPIVFLKLFKTNANTVGGGQPVLTGPGFVEKSNAAQVEKLAGEGTR